VLGCLEALVLMRPEVFMGLADSKFDAQGQLTDEATTKVLAAQMSAFETWIRRMGPQA
jgi:chromate reductase